VGTVADLTVGALLYRVTRHTISALWIEPSKRRDHVAIGSVAAVLPKVEELHDELRDSMSVARGRLPRLREFASGWGRDLLPQSVLESPPDILVIVPHGFIHDIPLHLVARNDDAEPLGCASGVTYVSSQSLFARCVARNRARCRQFGELILPEQASPLNSSNSSLGRRLAGGGVDVLGGQHEKFSQIPELVAELIAKPSNLLNYDALTRSAVKNLLRDHPDILFLVAHGYVNPANHELSGLMLPEPNIAGFTSVQKRALVQQGELLFAFRDLPFAWAPPRMRSALHAELLTAAELEIDVNVETELVVLLACSAGYGRVVAGDKPASIAETMLRAGAASVLAPAWDSDYESARDWILAFFRSWIEYGYPKAIAFKHAMQRIRDLHGDTQPGRLGALTLRGDWL